MFRAIICTALVIAAFAMPWARRMRAGKRGRRMRMRPSRIAPASMAWGYYDNPWCSPAEQLRWDRWDVRRTGR
jgi:hypothetical protein